MKSKTLYLIAAVIIVVGGLLVLNQAFNKTSNGPAQTNSPSASEQEKKIADSGNGQNAQNQPAAQTPLQGSTINGCPNGQNIPFDASGKFVPTVDIKDKTVTLETSMGQIKVELYDEDAPKTVENFICLAQKGYYNGVTFHRVAHNFVIQAGDPTGTGAGGESIYGATFEDELNPNTASFKAGYAKGVLAMANRGPNTNSSQFFITLDDLNSALGKNYTIYGKVVAGMDVVEKIGNVPLQGGAEDGKPVTTITINKAVVN